MITVHGMYMLSFHSSGNGLTSSTPPLPTIDPFLSFSALLNPVVLKLFLSFPFSEARKCSRPPLFWSLEKLRAAWQHQQTLFYLFSLNKSYHSTLFHSIFLPWTSTPHLQWVYAPLAWHVPLFENNYLYPKQLPLWCPTIIHPVP